MTMNGASAATSLLGLLLCSHLLPPVSPIMCFVCSSSPTNEQCNLNNQTCPQPLDTCMTIIDILGSTKAIVKQCASSATCSGAASSAVVDQDGNGNIVNCCNSNNLCNFSGAPAVHAHAALPALCLASLLLVVR